MNIFKKCLNTVESEEGSWTKLVEDKKWFCNNCGKSNHQNSVCNYPITSYGIILFYYSSDSSIIEENLLIQEWYMNYVSTPTPTASPSLSPTLSPTLPSTLPQDQDPESDPVILSTSTLTEVKSQTESGLGFSSVADSVKATRTEDTEVEINVDRGNSVQYLLILDRHTPDYTQIILGNYEIDNLESIDYLRRLLGRITEIEANLILKNNFRDLFMKYWIYSKKDPIKLYHKQFEKANESFNKLCRGISLRELKKKNRLYKDKDKDKDNDKDIDKDRDKTRDREIDKIRDRERDRDCADIYITWSSLIEETSPHWFDPDWGFPKGRRRRKTASTNHESDIECAMRELQEETGITPDQYHILDEISPIYEDIKGSNGFNYRNIYYLAEAKTLIPVFLDPKNILQSSEVSKIGWYNYERVSRLIRPYHTGKLKILNRVHKYLGSLSPYLN